MNSCQMPVWLGYAMAVYVIASIYYLIATRSVGTPFNDSLNAKQRKIKERSANIRRNIFIQGVIIACISLAIFRPFHKCLGK